LALTGAAWNRILSIGGDGNLGSNRNVSVNRFKPVVKFMGPFHLAAGEKQTTAFKLPQYVGSVKAMVVAGHDGAIRHCRKSGSVVKKPLMILATLTTRAGPIGESAAAGHRISRWSLMLKRLPYRYKAMHFSNLEGNNTQNPHLRQNRATSWLTFDLDVKDFVGVGKVKVVAKSGSETAAYDVELNVRNPNPACYPRYR
jgi:uncharacterized protein YfaS (alpha-2-macroglobulin family)